MEQKELTILEFLMENLTIYKEELERVDLDRKQLFTKNRTLQKTLKTIDELREQGIGVEIPQELLNPKAQLDELDKDKKILKSIIRRYESVIEMYQ